VTHSLPSSLPAGFWLKAYIITSEEADMVVEVANAMPVKRSTKAIANNSPWFLVIVTKNSYCFIAYSSIFNKKIEKLIYTL
jgi:hypothetical protein